MATFTADDWLDSSNDDLDAILDRSYDDLNEPFSFFAEANEAHNLEQAFDDIFKQEGSDPASELNSQHNIGYPSDPLINSRDLLLPSNPETVAPSESTNKRKSDQLAESVVHNNTEPAPKAKRSRRKALKPELSQEEKEAKHQSFLDRNKAAAMKCRQKRKGWLADLEKKVAQKHENHMILYEQLKQSDAEIMRILDSYKALSFHGDCACPHSSDLETQRFHASIQNLKLLHVKNLLDLDNAEKTAREQQEADRHLDEQRQEVQASQASKVTKATEKRRSSFADSAPSGSNAGGVQQAVFNLATSSDAGPQPSYTSDHLERMRNLTAQGITTPQYRPDLQQSQPMAFQQASQQFTQHQAAQYPTQFTSSQHDMDALRQRYTMSRPGSSGFIDTIDHPLLQQGSYTDFMTQAISRTASGASIRTHPINNLARTLSSGSQHVMIRTHSRTNSHNSSVYDSPGSGHSSRPSYDFGDSGISVSGSPANSNSPFNYPPRMGTPMVATGSNDSVYTDHQLAYTNGQEYLQYQNLAQLPLALAKGPQDLMGPAEYLQLAQNPQ